MVVGQKRRRTTALVCVTALNLGITLATALVHQNSGIHPGNRLKCTTQLYSIPKDTFEEEVWERIPLLKGIAETSSNGVEAAEGDADPLMRLFSLEESNDISQTPAQRVALLSMSVMTSSVLVLHLETLTMQFEAIQAWRYTWPLIGVLYIAIPLLLANNKNNVVVANNKNNIVGELSWNHVFPNQQTALLTGAVSILGGFGLLIGGCYDVFAPVWVSSPDLLGTRTGIESDSAAILLLLTIGIGSRLQLTPVRALFLAVLSAQLYEMGAYTFTALSELLHLIPI